MYKDLYKYHNTYYLSKAVKLKNSMINIKKELMDAVVDINSIFADKLFMYNLKINIDYDNISISNKIRRCMSNMKCITKEDMHFKYLLSKIHSLTINYKKYTNEYKIILEIKNIPYPIFKYIIRRNNEINQYDVLRGKKWYLGLSAGHIQIMRTKRKFYTQEGNNKLTINWGESIKLLKEIAMLQEQDGLHNLYSQLINNKIQFSEFDRLMKPYVYSHEKPKQPKYLVYNTNDYYNWWYWKGRNMFLKNMRLYIFTPTAYINTKDRMYEKLVNSTTNVQDIINNKQLGNLDKVSIACAIQPNYSLKFELKNE